MNDTSREKVVELWDEFTRAGYVFVDEDGDRQEYHQREVERKERLPHIRDLISSFFESDIDLLQFRKSIDVESKQHTQWGFGGTTQMFFNMLCNSATRQDRVGEVAREFRAVLPIPESKDDAEIAIQQLAALVNDLKANAENKQKAPKQGIFQRFSPSFGISKIPIGFQSTTSPVGVHTRNLVSGPP